MERLEFERVVSTKIRSNLNEDFLNIISIPCFHNINEYTEYIKEQVFNINHGSLNKEKLKLPYNGTDYPLAAAFESENREKTWDEMTNEEKKDFDKAFIDELLKAIDQVIEK